LWQQSPHQTEPLVSYFTVHRPYSLEIAVESIEAALAAVRGGAHRLELCSQLAAGGLTPSTELIRAARKRISLPIFAMIRPREGDFVYSDFEFTTMQRDVEAAKQLGMNGVVLGLLRNDGSVDIERTRHLVELAGPLPVTFHRAFDTLPDLAAALDDVIHTGAARILTSGGAPTALQGLAKIARLVAAAQDRIVIVPGRGINSSNIREVVYRTRACEFHSGLGTRMPYGRNHYDLFEKEVCAMASVLAKRS